MSGSTAAGAAGEAVGNCCEVVGMLVITRGWKIGIAAARKIRTKKFIASQGSLALQGCRGCSCPGRQPAQGPLPTGCLHPPT